MKKSKSVGIITAGGDSPGLNAALRGIGKAAQGVFDMEVIGFLDGFQGLMQDRTIRLDSTTLSGILTIGGTILGTSRDKPEKMPVGGKMLDMTEAMCDTYRKHHLDVLVCIGGGGTHKSAYTLMNKGLNILTLPKTIDNDICKTNTTIGFDTALGVATEAIDRLHSTAHSHHRIVVVEIMGHNTGWLTLGSGVAGGADVILIPEIPYDVKKIAEAILRRSRGGKRFSIVAVAEGAMSTTEANVYQKKASELKEKKKKVEDKIERQSLSDDFKRLDANRTGGTLRLATELEKLTELESRVSILGYLQRGGAPSAADRLLATRLGTACAALINEGKTGLMVAARGHEAVPVPLEKVAGKRKTVPLEHPWLESARRVGTCLGD